MPAKELSVTKIREMTGIHDEDLIQMIIACGAGMRDIQQACDKYRGAGCTKPGVERPMSPKARMIEDLIECSRGECE